MKQIICIKWGDRYGPEYVNRLHGMIARNITPPFKLHCFTDNVEGLRNEIVSHPLPELGCDLPKNTRGKWRKTALWAKELDGLEGMCLFVDLDTVIVSNIDDMFSFGDEHDVILARNWLKPFSRLGQTTLFRFYIGDHSYLLDRFRESAQDIADSYQFEQHYVTKNVEGGVKLWPKKWVKHYRHHCLGSYVSRYFRPARLPSGTKIVAFPGDPNPADALVGQWTGGVPVSRKEHLRNLFHPNRRIKPSIKGHIRCFQLPCPWVAEHWRE